MRISVLNGLPVSLICVMCSAFCCVCVCVLVHVLRSCELRATQNSTFNAAGPSPAAHFVWVFLMCYVPSAKRPPNPNPLFQARVTTAGGAYPPLSPPAPSSPGQDFVATPGPGERGISATGHRGPGGGQRSRRTRTLLGRVLWYPPTTTHHLSTTTHCHYHYLSAARVSQTRRRAFGGGGGGGAAAAGQQRGLRVKKRGEGRSTFLNNTAVPNCVDGERVCNGICDSVSKWGYLPLRSAVQ
jgi:hypothetical protein